MESTGRELCAGHCARDESGNLARAGFGLALAVAGGVVAAHLVHRMLSPPVDLRGKRVLITGGSRGLGFELAREFVARGARAAICARDRMELSRARSRISADDQQVFAMVCDVTDRASVERMVRTVEQRLGGIDILVNNAGIITLGPLETMTVEDFEYTMKVQFWGPLFATLAVLPGMKARRRRGRRQGGQIVNISSIGGKIGVPQLAPYCASKFALQGLSESLHAELRKDGISVTVICPGIMRTGGHLNSLYKGRHREGFAWMNAFNLIPGMSVSAEYAARRIVDAVARRESELVLGSAAKLADKAHGLLPGIFVRLESLAARLLPGPPRPGDIGRAYATGLESEPGVLPRWFKGSIYRNAARHNQFAGMKRSGAARVE